ncbi:MAG: PadR family transcriptional regulator [Promethearchaeota archaeon]
MPLIGKDLEITSMQALFLMVLNYSASRSGTEIVQEISTKLGDDWMPSPGATYKILQSLQTKGYIQETTKDEKRSDGRIRTYSLTSKGKEMVMTLSTRVIKLYSFMSTCCPECCADLSIVNTGNESKC